MTVFPNKGYNLHTTHSWEFMGLEDGCQALPDSIWEQTDYGEDIIIANIDTGRSNCYEMAIGLFLALAPIVEHHEHESGEVLLLHVSFPFCKLYMQ